MLIHFYTLPPTSGVTDCAVELFSESIEVAEDAMESVVDFAEDIAASAEKITAGVIDDMQPLFDAMDKIQKPLIAMFQDKGCKEAGGQMKPSGLKYPSSMNPDWLNFDLGIEWQKLEYCALPQKALLAILWQEEVIDGITSACTDLLGTVGIDDSVCDLFDEIDTFASMDAAAAGDSFLSIQERATARNKKTNLRTQAGSIVEDVVDTYNDVADAINSIEFTNGRAILGACDGDWSMALSLELGIGVRRNCDLLLKI